MSQKELPSKPPKISNVLKYRMANELGSISDKNFEREYFKMRLYKQRLREEISLNDLQSRYIVSVSFIKGMGNSVFGVWEAMEAMEDIRFKYVIGERTFIDLPYRQNLGFIACKCRIVDMFLGPNDIFGYLYNLPVTGSGYYTMLSQSSNDSEDPESFFFNTSLYCSTNTDSRELYAFGCNGSIGVFREFQYYDETYTVNGRIYTISLDQPSNLMVSGNDSGYLYMHDLRQRHLQGRYRVSYNCINDSYLLDSNQIIASGPDNFLCKFDLRMRRPVAEYYGHVASVKKRRLSVANGMLCASGSDNVVRIWSLSGGNPIHEMKPINHPLNQVRGWLYSDCNKTYLYQFEGRYERIYEIT